MESPTVRIAAGAAGSRRRAWPWLAGGLAVVAVASVLVIATAFVRHTGTTPVDGAAPAPTAQGPSPATEPSTSGDAETDNGGMYGQTVVKYSVFGDGGATISYGPEGDTEEDTADSLPWTMPALVDNGSGTYTLTARSTGTGEIECFVRVNGRTVAQQASSGPGAVVNCVGTATTGD